MYNWCKLFVVFFTLSCFAFSLFAVEEKHVEYGYSYFGKNFNFGKTATPKEIKGWDTDVRYDGHGAPKGSGSVEEGEILYENKCTVCHGAFGEGEGRWPKLSGGEGTLTDQLTSRPEKTVGSYWPYVGTLWDYIHRAMPYTAPNSLSDDETYAITAYVLYLNDIVEDDFVLNQDTILEIEMPNAGNFIPDPRPDTKNPICMKDCKSQDDIHLLEHIKGVTPTDHLNQKEDTSQITQAGKPKKVEIHFSGAGKAGAKIYQGKCTICHLNAVGGAPKIGAESQAEWKKRLEQGFSVLVEHAIHGYQGEKGVMPPKGGFIDLTDEEIRQTVIYMIEASQLKAE